MSAALLGAVGGAAVWRARAVGQPITGTAGARADARGCWSGRGAPSRRSSSLLPRWDRELLASGAYKYAPYLQPSDLDTVLRAGRLRVLQGGRGWHRHRPPADRDARRSRSTARSTRRMPATC